MKTDLMLLLLLVTVQQSVSNEFMYHALKNKMKKKRKTAKQLNSTIHGFSCFFFELVLVLHQSKSQVYYFISSNIHNLQQSIVTRYIFYMCIFAAHVWCMPQQKTMIMMLTKVRSTKKNWSRDIELKLSH